MKDCYYCARTNADHRYEYGLNPHIIIAHHVPHARIMKYQFAEQSKALSRFFFFLWIEADTDQHGRVRICQEFTMRNERVGCISEPRCCLLSISVFWFGFATFAFVWTKFPSFYFFSIVVVVVAVVFIIIMRIPSFIILAAIFAASASYQDNLFEDILPDITDSSSSSSNMFASQDFPSSSQLPNDNTNTNINNNGNDFLFDSDSDSDSNTIVDLFPLETQEDHFLLTSNPPPSSSPPPPPSCNQQLRNRRLLRSRLRPRDEDQANNNICNSNSNSNSNSNDDPDSVVTPLRKGKKGEITDEEFRLLNENMKNIFWPPAAPEIFQDDERCLDSFPFHLCCMELTLRMVVWAEIVGGGLCADL